MRFGRVGRRRPYGRLVPIQLPGRSILSGSSRRRCDPLAALLAKPSMLGGPFSRRVIDAVAFIALFLIFALLIVVV